MTRFSLRDLFWLTLVVAMALVDRAHGAEPEGMWFFTHNRPGAENRKPLPKPWEDVVGRQVVGEGIAWHPGKGVGEYVMLDRAIVYVADGDFLNADAVGRAIRVRGKLTSRTEKAALPGQVGPSRDITIFEIVDAKWEFIDRVKWPWLTDME